MFKRLLFLSVVSGILAAIASLIYQQVYTSSLGAEYPTIVGTAKIFAACIIGNIVAGIGYFFLLKWLKANTDIVFNLLFVILSFATILSPFAVKLPLDVEFPELLPGLLVPMHFFPVLAWLTLRPIFLRSSGELYPRRERL